MEMGAETGSGGRQRRRSRRVRGEAVLFDEGVEIADVAREISGVASEVVPAAGIAESNGKIPIPGK